MLLLLLLLLLGSIGCFLLQKLIVIVSMVIAFLIRNIILKTKKEQGKQPIVKMDIKKNCGKKF